MTTKIVKEFEIEEPIAKVWASLADPTDVVTCVPGAAITEKIDDKNYKGEVVTMDITIVGKLAQFGSRLINDVSDQLIGQFVDNFKSKLSGGEVDNDISAGSMLGTVAKSIFGKKK